jgi:hypothetical protein
MSRTRTSSRQLDAFRQLERVDARGENETPVVELNERVKPHRSREIDFGIRNYELTDSLDFNRE